MQDFDLPPDGCRDPDCPITELLDERDALRERERELVTMLNECRQETWMELFLQGEFG